LATSRVHSSTGTAALAEAERGYLVLPTCWPDDTGRCACPKHHTNPRDVGKAPLTDDGVLSATLDRAQIERWWATWPEANVAIALAPSGLVVVDPDSDEAQDEAIQLGLPPTRPRISRYPAYLYLRPDDCPAVNAIRMGRSGALDVLGRGYVLVYGRHRAGIDIYLEDLPPGPAPEWAVELLRQQEAEQNKPKINFADDPDAAAKGAMLWATIREYIPEYIRVTVEEGPDAYEPRKLSAEEIARGQRKPDASRSGADGAVLYRLISYGLSDDQIRQVYLAMPIGRLGKYAERGDKYLGHSIVKQRAFVERVTLRPSASGNGHRTDTPPPRSPNSTAHVEADELPSIDAGEQDLRVITPQVWGLLKQANARRPFAFRHGGLLMRVELDDYLRPVLRELTAPRLRHELAQLARFYVVRGKNERDTYPPNHLIEDMLATPNPPLPVVTRVTECPTFAPDGSLQTAMGYHPASQTYYAPPSGLEIPPVPTSPSATDLAEAKRLLLDELLGDFPFVNDADRAHLVGLGLLPSARDLIPGPTPLHMVEAPMPGSGKGLAVEAALRPGCGRNIGAIAQARDDDEMRKRVTAMLRDGHPAIQIDNLTGALDSGSLSAALTLPAWTDRILGQTATVRIPIRCVWVATANNPVVSTEIARRSIRVRLDPKQDRPWERAGWRHPELLSWVDEHRGRLIWANLVLIQSWVAAGRPGFSGRVLGSYEQWSHVIGGILGHAGIGGFLGNLAEFYEQADVETAVWRAFVEAWWEAHGTTEVGTAELFPLTESVEGMEFDGKTPQAQRVAFGKALSRQRDRVVGEYRITKAGELRRAMRWRLLPTDGSGVLL
jgi:hypothetical protein